MLDNLATPLHLLMLLLSILLVAVPFWKIFSKAGFPGPVSLLMLIPLVNIIMLYVLAYSPWKTLPGEANRTI